MSIFMLNSPAVITLIPLYGTEDNEVLTKKTRRSGIFIVALMLDQITKNWALNNLYSEFREQSFIPCSIGLHLHCNYGIAFSLMQNWPQIGLLLNLAALCLLLLLYRKLDYAGIAFLLAGTVGNFLDRMRFGYVIDWFYIGMYFNFADVWLCIGIVLIFVNVFFKSEKKFVQ